MSQERKFCSKCGATLTEGAAFCSKCGTPVSSVAQAMGTPPMPPTPPPAYRGEKAEKHEKGEKDEKHEKGGQGGDLGGALVGGAILIWLGISFYLAQRGTVTWNDWWAYFLTGLGVILIFQGLFRRTRRGYPMTGSITGGAVLLVIGLAVIYGVRDWWPLILVVIGVIVIFSGVRARRRTPEP